MSESDFIRERRERSEPEAWELEKMRSRGLLLDQRGARRALCAVLRARVPKVCPWCGAYDGPCFHCGRCADCGALERQDDEHAVGCFFRSA